MHKVAPARCYNDIVRNSKPGPVPPGLFSYTQHLLKQATAKAKNADSRFKKGIATRKSAFSKTKTTQTKENQNIAEDLERKAVQRANAESAHGITRRGIAKHRHEKTSQKWPRRNEKRKANK